MEIPLTRSNQDGASNADYTGVPASVTFTSGDTVKSFTFTATQDTVDDDGESVRLAFGTLPTRVSAVSPAATTVVIDDDDVPVVTVSFASASYSVAESDDPNTANMTENQVEVTVTLSADPERTVAVPLTVTHQGGATSQDYSGVPASVTFTSGVMEQTFRFSAVDDAVDDDDESVKLAIGATLPAAVTAGATDAATVAILDDDDPAVTVSFGQVAHTVAEGDDVTVTVTLSADPERTVEVPITTTNVDGAANADYSGVPPRVTFVSGDTTETFSLVAEQDAVDDDGERVLLSFGTLPTRVSSASPSQVTVSIRDDDGAGVTVTPTALPIAEGSNATYRVVLDSQPTADVAVSVTVPGGSDVSVDKTALTFTASTWNEAQTVTVSAAQDDDAVDDVVSITHAATSTDSDYSGISVSAVRVTVTDDEDVPVTVEFEQATYTVAEGDEVTVTVTLSADPERTVAIPLTVTRQGGASSTDYSGVPSAVTFTSGDTEQTFKVTANQDTVDDDGESVRLTIGATLPTAVSAGATAATTVAITDDDDPAVTVSFGQATYAVEEGERCDRDGDAERGSGADGGDPVASDQPGRG